MNLQAVTSFKKKKRLILVQKLPFLEGSDSRSFAVALAHTSNELATPELPLYQLLPLTIFTALSETQG